jgi:hypothetical protein
MEKTDTESDPRFFRRASPVYLRLQSGLIRLSVPYFVMKKVGQELAGSSAG